MLYATAEIRLAIRAIRGAAEVVMTSSESCCNNVMALCSCVTVSLASLLSGIWGGHDGVCGGVREVRGWMSGW